MKFPYPCIGMFRFLSLSLTESPVYDEVVSRLKDGEKLLDLGCCFGQEIRQLVSDGVPAENLYGSDLRMDFIDLGYSLFLDQGKLKSTFIAADALNPASPLSQLDGQIDIVQASSFFHLFNWDEQVVLGKRIVALCKQKAGSMLVGRQIGNLVPGEYPGRYGQRTRYRHDEGSWKKMWEQIGNETQTTWKVQVTLQRAGEEFSKSNEERSSDWNPQGMERLRFVVIRE